MDDPTYSIAVCNYNMANTLENSLRSILDQVDPNEFEVIVVDGGSNDGSCDILRSLEREYSHLRAILDRTEECKNLGGDRNISFKESQGDYILESLDTDDRYFSGIIEDFVKIYHTFEPCTGDSYFLSGTGINMAPRKLLLDIPYYDLGGAEDRDLFRRLFANDSILWLKHGAISEEIGYHMSLRDELHRDIHGKMCDFQSGITLSSALMWSLHHERHFIFERDRGPVLNILKKPYDFFSHVYAYLNAPSREQHDVPPEFKKKGALEQRIAKERVTLPELVKQFDVKIDRSEFSKTGRRAFFSGD